MENKEKENFEEESFIYVDNFESNFINSMLTQEWIKDRKERMGFDDESILNDLGPFF